MLRYGNAALLICHFVDSCRGADDEIDLRIHKSLERTQKDEEIGDAPAKKVTNTELYCGIKYILQSMKVNQIDEKDQQILAVWRVVFDYLLL